MKHKILTFFLACLVPWLAGAQQSANSQNNVAEKDYIAYLFTYFTGNHISEEAVCYAVSTDGANGDKGEDGDSFFKSVVQDDENVTFTLTNGDQIVLPKAKEVNFVIERTSLTLKFGASQNLAVTQKGVENLAIAKPDGWRAWLEGDVLTITAPAKENVYAETSGEVSVVAVGATATVIAKVQVLATDEILGGAGAGSSEWEEWN